MRILSTLALAAAFGAAALVAPVAALAGQITVTGEGRVALVLDVDSLVQAHETGSDLGARAWT